MSTVSPTDFTPEQIEEWSMLFGSCAGTWPWWHSIRHETGDWDQPGLVRLTIESPDDHHDTISKVFTPRQIFEGQRAAIERYPNIDPENHDADSADVVLQFIALGSVVYA